MKSVGLIDTRRPGLSGSGCRSEFRNTARSAFLTPLKPSFLPSSAFESLFSLVHDTDRSQNPVVVEVLEIPFRSDGCALVVRQFVELQVRTQHILLLSKCSHIPNPMFSSFLDEMENDSIEGSFSSKLSSIRNRTSSETTARIFPIVSLTSDF